MTGTPREIKARDLFEFLQEVGLEDVVDRGPEVGARCPLHERRTGEREKRPNHWSMNKLTLQHNCFSCGYRGSIQRMLVEFTGDSLWAVTRMLRTAGIEAMAPDVRVEPPAPRVLPEVQIKMFGDPPPRALKRRGISTASAAVYGVRWAAGDSAWVLPIRSPEGELMGYQTKSPDRVMNHPPRVKKSRTLFGLDLVPRPCRRLILVESPLDAVRIHEAGYEAQAVASFGSIVSDEQLRLCLSWADLLVLGLDNDTSGIKETRRILSAGWQRRFPLTVLNYYGMKKVKDPGDMSDEQIDWAITNAELGIYWREP